MSWMLDGIHIFFPSEKKQVLYFNAVAPGYLADVKMQKHKENTSPFYKVCPKHICMKCLK